MSPEISPRNSFDGFLNTQALSSPNTNDTNTSEIYSNASNDTPPAQSAESCKMKSNFDIPENDLEARLQEQDLENDAPETKKLRLINAIKILKEENYFSDIQSRKKVIETLAMSPKISNLSEYYDRYYDCYKASDSDPDKGIRYTELSLESLKEYLKYLYPEEKILAVKGTFEKEVFDELLKTKEGKPTYIVYQTSPMKYKMLLVFQFKNNKFQLNVLNSLGISLCDKESTYKPFVKYIFKVFYQFFNRYGLRYEDSHTPRQDDESNCSALIIDDMRIARELIAAGKDFELYKRGPLNYEFLKTCRAVIPHGKLNFCDENNHSLKYYEETNGYIEKKYILPMSKRDRKPNPYPLLVNSKPTWLSLDLLEYFIRHKAVFTSPPEVKISITDILKKV